MTLTNPRVLILTNERDISVDWVVRLLRANRVPYLRLNTERILDYTLELSPLKHAAILNRQDIAIDLSLALSVWYRRPDPPGSRPSVSDAERDLVRAQWRTATRGLKHVLRARWINPPDRNDAAEQKILQLERAQAIGFDVPPTLVTSDTAAVRRFQEEHGPLIIKGLDAPYIEDPDGNGRFVFTTPLNDGQDLEGLEQAPLIFQAEVKPKQDVRVTVVGDQVFAASIEEDVSEVDWRAVSTPPRFVSHDLPSDILKKSVEIVRQFGLVFGAIDLVIDGAGGYWFLELNPNGEWGWLQKKAALPIAEAIFEELTHE